MVCELMLAFDHLRHEVTVLGYAFCEPDSVDTAYDHAVGVIDAARDALRGPVPDPRPRPQPPAGGPPAPGTFEPEGVEGPWVSNLSREHFESNVARIVEYTHAGDAFQVVPSQRFTAPATVEAFSIYRGLRTVNPSPYMYFLEFDDFEIAGASPEPLVKVSGRRAETRPIAGTYPRGANEEEDRAQAAALLDDPKERAEHVMLVDLGRNDLGRVCEYGTVNVDEYMVVETYSHVFHIVSQVSGTLREGITAMDVLRATLPAGTLSGAPKVRAMQIIDELEPHKRCSYGGAIGYLGFTGDLDTAIHIRTAVIKDGLVHVQAGGGTVADAKPDYEYRESREQGEGDVPGGGAGRGASRSGDEGARDRQLRLVHLQPRPVPGRARGGGRGGPQRQGDGRRAARAPPRPAGDLARAVHAGRGGDLDRGLARLPRGRDPDAGRLPRPPGDGRGVRRPHDPRRADPRQGRRRSTTTAAGSSAISRTRCAAGGTTRWSPIPSCRRRSSRPRPTRTW